MVDHLKDASARTLQRSNKDTKRDEAEMRHRGVRDQSLQVPLHGGDDTAIEDPDDRKSQREGYEPAHRIGEQRDREADESVGPHLEEDRGSTTTLEIKPALLQVEVTHDTPHYVVVDAAAAPELDEGAALGVE